MFDCPECRAPLSNKAVACNTCGWIVPSKAAPDERIAEIRSTYSDPELARARLLALTASQWYAVCKFFPGVAARSSRQLVQTGPDQPLDRLVKKGPLFADAEALAERAAIQAEQE